MQSSRPCTAEPVRPLPLRFRDRHQVFIDYEFTKVGELICGCLYNIFARRFIGGGLCHAFGERFSRCPFVAFGFQARRYFAEDQLLCDLLEFCEVDIDALGLLEHRLKFIGAERKAVIRRLFLLLKPCVKFLDGLDRRIVRLFEILLRSLVLNRLKDFYDILRHKIRQATDCLAADLDKVFGHRQFHICLDLRQGVRHIFSVGRI